MIDPAIFIGAPLHFYQVCKVYPPTIYDVVTNQRFTSFKTLLTFTDWDVKEQLADKLKEGDQAPTPLEYILINAFCNGEVLKIVKAAFEFFIREPITFLWDNKAIIIGTDEEIKEKTDSMCQLRTIDETNFFVFQNFIRRVCGDPEEKEPEPIDPNEDPRIRRIKEKARLRDRIKAKKGVQGQGLTLEKCLVSICCMGIGITPLNIGEMSYASIGPIMNIYQQKEKYDLDTRALLAGADSKKIKPKYWIRNTD